jgi:hypothetical protein
VGKTHTLSQQIHAAFAVHPVPASALRNSDNFWRDSDIWSSLKQFVAYRRWDELTLHDWAMIGTTPGIARYYLDAHAFHYYVPSILVNVFETGQYPEFAIDALVSPDFSNVNARDELETWWTTFISQFSPSQKACVCNFVEHIKSNTYLHSDEIRTLNHTWWLL